MRNTPRGERSHASTGSFSSRWSAYLWGIILGILLLGWIVTHRLVEQKERTETQRLEELYWQTKHLFHEITNHNISLLSPLIKPEVMSPDLSGSLIQCQSSLARANQQVEECKNGQSVVTATTGANEKWLVIGIPTVSRNNDEPYLLRTLESISSQLPSDPDDVMFGRVLVIVVNMQVNANPNRKHKIFEEAKQKYSSEENPQLSSSFLFLELQREEIIDDPIPGRNPHNDLGNANKPGFLVRRQTRNIVSVMRKSLNRGRYYLFLEDDMVLCHHGLFAIEYLLRKANAYHPNWLAIRTSYGMNGIFMHNKDLEVFAGYLLKHQARRPPDHLVVEWYAGETAEAKSHRGNRANIGFKWNLFDHLGVVSTLRSQKAGAMPRCYEMLIEPVVFQVEAYNPQQCGHEDIWPCHHIKHKKIPLIDWSNIRP